MSKKILQKLSKEILEYEYKVCGSMQKMSNKLDVSIDTISKYMKLYNIPYNKHYSGIYSCNKNFFTNDNELSFYWAGFIAADGSLQKRKNSKILKICLSITDFSHIEKFKIDIESNNPIKIYDVKPSQLVKFSHKCAELSIVSNQIFDDLARFNIVPRKTKIYDFPEWLIKHPLVHHFMRGYFDGDGCISNCGLGTNRTVKQGAWSILGNYNFIQNYKNILIQNSNLNDAKITKHYSVFQINYSGNKNIEKLYNFLYKDATIYLDRKYNKIINYIVVPKLPNAELTTN